MSKGTNPSSHHNKPKMGIEKKIKMPQEYWDFAHIVGAKNFSEGVREMTRAVQIDSDRRLRMAAQVIGAFSSSPEQIQLKLMQLFPDIDSGRKTSGDLMSEIILGESRLQLIDDAVVRVVRVASVDIPCPLGDDRYLHELRQEYPTKNVERNLSGVSEKIQGDEDPLDAGLRGIKEELGIVIGEEDIRDLGYELVDNLKSAYNGIVSKTLLYRFEATIKESDFRQEYREVQESKITVFGWR